MLCTSREALGKDFDKIYYPPEDHKNDEKLIFLIFFRKPLGGFGKLLGDPGWLQRAPGGSGRLEKGFRLMIGYIKKLP